MEELAEFQQSISKCLRFGPNDKHPRKETTNFQDANLEYTDVLLLLNLLSENGVTFEYDLTHAQWRRESFHQYLKYAKSKGIVYD